MKYLSIFIVIGAMVCGPLSHGQATGKMKIMDMIANEQEDINDYVLDIPVKITTPESYAFGESEGEWTLQIIPAGDSCIVQCKFGHWQEDSNTHNAVAWVFDYITFNHVSRTGNVLMCGKLKVMLAAHKVDGVQKKCALINGEFRKGELYKGNVWERGDYLSIESGYAKDTVELLSQKVLQPEFFKGVSKQRLAILRNSLYAKYAYIFKKGGEAEAYFKAKGGYYPRHADVAKFFTTIELKNIATIKELESSH